MAKIIKFPQKKHAEMTDFEIKQDMKKRLKRLKAADDRIRGEDEQDVFGEMLENWE